MKYHIVNQHSQCPPHKTKKRAWLIKDSDAHIALVAIIDDEKLQERIHHCSDFMKTSFLESFHYFFISSCGMHERIQIQFIWTFPPDMTKFITSIAFQLF